MVSETTARDVRQTEKEPPCRLLVADDQPHILEAIRLLLKPEGYELRIRTLLARTDVRALLRQGHFFRLPPRAAIVGKLVRQQENKFRRRYSFPQDLAESVWNSALASREAVDGLWLSCA